VQPITTSTKLAEKGEIVGKLDGMFRVGGRMLIVAGGIGYFAREKIA